MQTLITDATLVLPDRLIEAGWLLIEDGRIAGLGDSSSEPAPGLVRWVDAGGSFVLPGLIDLHCDSIERLVEPRPNVSFEIGLALAEVDRRLAGCGITTEFHAISLDDHEFGVRSVEFARDLAMAIQAHPDSLIRHQIHARYEVTSERGFRTVQEMIAGREMRLVSLMDHSPGQGQYASEEAYRNYVKRTASMSDADIDALLELKRRQQAGVPARIEEVSRQVREAGLALATHDDDSADKVSAWPRLGVTVIEFPTTLPAAQRAHDLGLAVCMGAPNVLRGKSSGGNLSALASIQAGLCDVLCADYYPSSMLTATFRLASMHGLSLPQAVRMVTLNPARAVGLDDEFGSLEVGKQADLVIVDLPQPHLPRVQRLFVGGQERMTLS